MRYEHVVFFRPLLQFDMGGGAWNLISVQVTKAGEEGEGKGLLLFCSVYGPVFFLIERQEQKQHKLFHYPQDKSFDARYDLVSAGVPRIYKIMYL